MTPSLRPYQQRLLEGLQALGLRDVTSLLDVGCGPATLLAEIQRQFSIPFAIGVDVVARRATGIDVPTVRFDGKRLPFATGAFGAISMVNVLHHVEPKDREALLSECARVCNGGAIYLKDHCATNAIDRARLTFLDLVGNAPLGGMVRASYLSDTELRQLLSAVGYREVARDTRSYRGGLYAAMLPNRLEVFLRLEPA